MTGVQTCALPILSSKRKLDYTGVTNTLAPYGTTGMLLLDPVSYYIATIAASTTDADHSSISISTLDTNLTSTNQTISATSDIYLANDFTWSGVGASTATRSLTFSAPLVVLGGSIAVSGSADDIINFTSGIDSSSKLFVTGANRSIATNRSEEHTSELQSLRHLVCRLLLEKKIENRK